MTKLQAIIPAVTRDEAAVLERQLDIAARELEVAAKRDAVVVRANRASQAEVYFHQSAGFVRGMHAI